MIRERDILHVASTSRSRKLQVVARVAADHGVTMAEIMGDSRKRYVVVPRWVAMATIRDTFGDSFASIGRLFNRDHTTVMHALRKDAA